MAVFSKRYMYIVYIMTMFIGSQSSISLPSFMFVSAPVSDIREANQNKEEKEKHCKFVVY